MQFRNVFNREANIIEIRSFSHPKDVSEFIFHINNILIKKCYPNIVIKTNNNCAFFPNAAVPICSLIEYLRESGYEISLYNNHSIGHTFDSPIEATQENISRYKESLSKIWKFGSSSFQVG